LAAKTVGAVIRFAPGRESTLTDFAAKTIIRPPKFPLAVNLTGVFAMDVRRLSQPFGIAAFALLFAAAAPAADQVQFTCRPPQVGHYGTHDVKYELALDVSLQQAGKTVSSEKQQMTRDQTRQITVMKVTGDRVMQVRVHYAKARSIVTRGKESGRGDAQPIEGKAYLVERSENNLVVTDADGRQIPDDERSLVVASMESVGRPNPLGKFLHGKTVAIGQTIELPRELATDLLGLRETGGDAQKVELTLQAVQQEPDRRVAKFAMLVVIKPDAKTSLDIKGEIHLDVNTCQVASANFTGPVAIEETFGPKGQTFQMRSDGTMRVAIRSHYANQ
jgi:hypothetical protein